MTNSNSRTKRFFQYYTHLMAYPVKVGLRIMLIEYFFRLAAELDRGIEGIPENILDMYIEVNGRLPTCVQDIFRRDISNQQPSVADRFELEIDDNESAEPCLYELSIDDITIFMLEINNSQYFMDYQKKFNDFFIGVLKVTDRFSKAIVFDAEDNMVAFHPEHFGIIEGKVNKRVGAIIEQCNYG